MVPSLDTFAVQAQIIWDLVSAPENTTDIRRGVTAEMFADKVLRDAFVSVLRAWDSGDPVSVSTLRGRISAEAYGALVGQLAGSVEASATASEVLNHIGLLRKDYFGRKALVFGRDLVEMSGQLDRLPDGLLSAVAKFQGEVEGSLGSEREMTAAAAAERLGERIREDVRLRQIGRSVACPTGFQFLDERFLGGFKPGDLTYIAARPSVGKTAIMLAMIKAAAVSGKSVKIWSLEMRADQLAERWMYSLGGLLPGEKVRGTVDWNGRWKEAVSALASWRVYVEDAMSDIDSILTDIAVSHQRGKCDIAFIDYFQLMSSRERTSSKEEKLAEMSRRLKLAAMAQDLPIVVASQLNRENVRGDREPDLQDMRGSGALEQDADRVIFLVPRGDDENRLIKMKIGKNRDGGHAGDSVTLKPDGTYTSFEVVQDSGIAHPPTAKQMKLDAWEREMQR